MLDKLASFDFYLAEVQRLRKINIEKEDELKRQEDRIDSLVLELEYYKKLLNGR